MQSQNRRVGYLTFGRDDFGYGLALCLQSIPNIFRVTPKTAKYVDWLLFSCFWWEHVYLLADFLRKAGIKKSDTNRPKIIIGGFNTLNPIPFGAYADHVVCGDGENILPGLLDGKEYEENLWHNSPYLKSFCHETNNIARIEIARGCKYRCKFCAVSHLKPYRELPIDGVEITLRSTRMKRVSLFAPEPTMHSQDKKITEIVHRLGKVRVDSDVRLDHLSNCSDSVPRVGIEGISEKLRRSVNKPYRNEQIIEAVRQAIMDGRKGLFMYFILDLPGEDEEDWQEFGGLLKKIGELPGASNFLLKPSPSVFLPSPHTPMEFDGINWDRDYARKWSAFFGRGEDRQWDVMMAERNRIFSPVMRVLSMVATRAGDEFFELERELSSRKIISISGGRLKWSSLPALLSALQPHGGTEKYCGTYNNDTAPWKILKFP